MQNPYQDKTYNFLSLDLIFTIKTSTNVQIMYGFEHADFLELELTLEPRKSNIIQVMEGRNGEAMDLKMLVKGKGIGDFLRFHNLKAQTIHQTDFFFVE